MARQAPCSLIPGSGEQMETRLLPTTMPRIWVAFSISRARSLREFLDSDSYNCEKKNQGSNVFKTQDTSRAYAFGYGRDPCWVLFHSLPSGFFVSFSKTHHRTYRRRWAASAWPNYIAETLDRAYPYCWLQSKTCTSPRSWRHTFFLISSFCFSLFI